MTDDERFRLDVAQLRFSDRKKVVVQTVSAVKEYFPEGITLGEIEGLLSDIRSKLVGGLITYTAPLDLAQENEDVAKRYRERIRKMNQSTE